MINTKQKLMSAMNTLFWFGPKISTYYESLSEPQLRSLLGGFSALSLDSEINPFAFRETIGEIDERIIYTDTLDKYVNNTQSNTIDIDTDYTFQRLRNRYYIDEIFHVNREITGTDIHTYDLSDLDDSFRGLTYKNKFKSVNVITIANKGSGDLPISFAETNGFGDFLGNPQSTFLIEGGGVFSRTSISSSWPVTSTNKVIAIGNGSTLDTEYELAILGRGDFE